MSNGMGWMPTGCLMMHVILFKKIILKFEAVKYLNDVYFLNLLK